MNICICIAGDSCTKGNLNGGDCSGFSESVGATKYNFNIKDGFEMRMQVVAV